MKSAYVDRRHGAAGAIGNRRADLYSWLPRNFCKRTPRLRVRLYAALMLGDPRFGIGFGGELADGSGICIRDFHFDVQRPVIMGLVNLNNRREEISPDLTVGNPGNLCSGCNRSWSLKCKLDKAPTRYRPGSVSIRGREPPNSRAGAPRSPRHSPRAAGRGRDNGRPVHRRD